MSKSRKVCSAKKATSSPLATTSGPMDSPSAHQSMINIDTDSLINFFESKLETMRTENKNAIDAIQLKLDALSNEWKDQYKQILGCVSALQEENANLRQEVKSLRDAQDEMEQRSRMCNIDIHGIPETKGENLMTLMEKIGSNINVPLPSSCVVSAHRVARGHSSPSNRPRNIVVQLSTKRLHDDVIAAARTRRGLTTEQLGLGAPTTNFYINEHLTLKNKILFAKTRAAGKANGYKYIWVRNGSILAKRNDLSRVVTIRREGDLLKITTTHDQQNM